MSWLSAIGLMNGTSYDGVDVALINTDGEDAGRIGPTLNRPCSAGSASSCGTRWRRRSAWQTAHGV